MTFTCMFNIFSSYLPTIYIFYVSFLLFLIIFFFSTSLHPALVSCFFEILHITEQCDMYISESDLFRLTRGSHSQQFSSNNMLLFFFILELCTIVYIYQIVFIHSSIDMPLAWFYRLAIEKSDRTNVGVQV